jgi:hypothetical protein
MMALARKHQRRVLIDTRDPYDASLLGFEGRTDTSEGGLIVSFQEFEGVGPCVTLTGIDGEIQVVGDVALRVLGETLLGALKLSQQVRAA